MVQKKQNKSYDIRTPRKGAMIGKRGTVGNIPVAVVKHGKTIDTISADEFVKALYGEDAQCVIMQGANVKQ